jgi:non-ribosomal peptide synthetase-like protein
MPTPPKAVKRHCHKDKRELKERNHVTVEESGQAGDLSRPRAGMPADGTVLASSLDHKGIRWEPGERLEQLFEGVCDQLRESGRQGHVAVDTGDDLVTYDELDGRANSLARHLLQRGARPGDRIALLFDHALPAYTAMLAALKIGAAYVPLDPGFPSDRLAYITNDADVSLVLTLTSLKDRLPETAAPLLCLDQERSFIERHDSSRLTDDERRGDPESLAYIIYTSGSTGRPKGVAIEHPSICNFIRVAAETYGISSRDRVYQGMTIAFDFSVEEIWVPWMAGATLVPKPRGTSLVGTDLAEYLTEKRITALCCVPTLLATLEDDLPNLRFLLVSGEACPRDLIVRWHRPGRRFLNVYGPTEATVTATMSVARPDRPVTLGEPLPTYSAVILHVDEGRALPSGELGEIGLAGVGLAKGYIHRDDLTEKAFIPDFLGIGNNPSGRIYRTGDLGRINGDGEIEYFGRIDTQVKIRGYRIELSELESVLLQMPGVAQAAVGTFEPEPGLTELVAYYSRRRGAAELDARMMQDHLRGMVPAYMVPAYFEELGSLPMLPSDKVDRKGLPAPSGTRITSRSRAFEMPSTDAEKLLAAALASALRCESVSVEDHFFNDLGANSMLMAKFCARARELGHPGNLSMKDTYLRPTIRSLAAGMAIQKAAPALPARIPAGPVRRASTAEYVLCGVLQALTFVAGAFLGGAVLVASVRFASAGTSWPEVLERSFVFSIALFLIMCLLPIIAKWIVVGRWKEQEIPLWTIAYFRFWLVRTLIRANPMRFFLGSPVYVLYLRALGANIGRGVAIFASDVPVCTDLLTVGDGAVIRKDSTFNCCRAIDGVIQTGPVTIGRDALVGEASMMEVGASLGDGAQLGHVSALYAGQAVPAGERWHGSPAQRTDVDYRSVEPAPCGTRRRVLYSFFMVTSRFVLLAPLGIGSLSILIPGYLSSGNLDHDSWVFYLDVLVFSLALVLGGIVLSLALVLTVPRLFELLVKPNKTYPLYGIHYGAHRTVGRITNLKTLMQLTGDSSLILHYLRILGYKFPGAQQTGTNFGVAVKHESPYQCTVGKGTMVADGLSMMNADYSSTSFKVSPVTIGDENFLGNSIYFPAGARAGDNCLLATKVMIPIDGPLKQDVGLLGSPSFEIPRSVLRDTEFDDLRSGEKFRKALAGKNRHNAVTIALYITVRWLYLFAVLMIASFAATASGIPESVSAGLAVFAIFIFSLVYFVLVEWASLGFKRLQPRFCSIYVKYFWRHERYWKLSGAAFFGILNGTPFKGLNWKILGARVGRRLYDDGCAIPEKNIVSIGDNCMLNAGSVIQCHSMEDGAFKLEGIRIGSDCTLGVKSFVHYGVAMADGAVLEADSFLMKGEEVPPNGWFGGNPASSMGEHHLAGETECESLEPGADDAWIAGIPARELSNRPAPEVPAIGRHAALPEHGRQRLHGSHVEHGRHALHGRRTGARFKD